MRFWPTADEETYWGPIGHFRSDEFQDHLLVLVSGTFIYGIDNDEGPLRT
jgi:hypothetical protein